MFVPFSAFGMVLLRSVLTSVVVASLGRAGLRDRVEVRRRSGFVELDWGDGGNP